MTVNFTGSAWKVSFSEMQNRQIDNFIKEQYKFCTKYKSNGSGGFGGRITKNPKLSENQLEKKIGDAIAEIRSSIRGLTERMINELKGLENLKKRMNVSASALYVYAERITLPTGFNEFLEKFWKDNFNLVTSLDEYDLINDPYKDVIRYSSVFDEGLNLLSHKKSLHYNYSCFQINVANPLHDNKFLAPVVKKKRKLEDLT